MPHRHRRLWLVVKQKTSDSLLNKQASVDAITEHFPCASDAGRLTSGIAIYGKKITGQEN